MRCRRALTIHSTGWRRSARKAGYAWDNLFLYGTAGVAFLKETETRTQYRSSGASASLPAGRTTDNFFVESADATRTGFTIGGGAEYAPHGSLVDQARLCVCRVRR